MNTILAFLLASACALMVQCVPIEEAESSYTVMKGGRWPGASIPYVIESSIGARGKQVIEQAMENYQKHTCIKFHERKSETAYLKIFGGRGCFSTVGYHPVRESIMSLMPACWETGIVMHELGHVVGFYAEHNRPDRDNYVKILHHNIHPRNERYFDKFPESMVESFGTPYDFESIMHVGPKAFSKNGKNTIETKDPSKQKLIGQRKGLSKIDIQRIKLMYKC